MFRASCEELFRKGRSLRPEYFFQDRCDGGGAIWTHRWRPIAPPVSSSHEPSSELTVCDSPLGFRNANNVSRRWSGVAYPGRDESSDKSVRSKTRPSGIDASQATGLTQVTPGVEP